MTFHCISIATRKASQDIFGSFETLLHYGLDWTSLPLGAVSEYSTHLVKVTFLTWKQELFWTSSSLLQVVEGKSTWQASAAKLYCLSSGIDFDITTWPQGKANKNEWLNVHGDGLAIHSFSRLYKLIFKPYKNETGSKEGIQQYGMSGLKITCNRVKPLW